MSHEAKQTASSFAKWTAIVTLLVILFTKAVGAGEILHEVKGLRGDLTEMKAMIERSRMDRAADLKGITDEHRKLERRIDALEYGENSRKGIR